jgi:hypothetical protein
MGCDDYNRPAILVANPKIQRFFVSSLSSQRVVTVERDLAAELNAVFVYGLR